jgi:hypothetical protein
MAPFPGRLFFTNPEETHTGLTVWFALNMMVRPTTLHTYPDQGDAVHKTGTILIQEHQPFTAPMVRPDWKYLLAYRNNTIKGMEMITAVAAK